MPWDSPFLEILLALNTPFHPDPHNISSFSYNIRASGPGPSAYAFSAQQVQSNTSRHLPPPSWDPAFPFSLTLNSLKSSWALILWVLILHLLPLEYKLHEGRDPSRPQAKRAQSVFVEWRHEAQLPGSGEPPLLICLVDNANCCCLGQLQGFARNLGGGAICQGENTANSRLSWCLEQWRLWTGRMVKGFWAKVLELDYLD